MPVTRKKNKIKIKDGLELESYKSIEQGNGTISYNAGNNTVTGSVTNFTYFLKKVIL